MLIEKITRGALLGYRHHSCGDLVPGVALGPVHVTGGPNTTNAYRVVFGTPDHKLLLLTPRHMDALRELRDEVDTTGEYTIPEVVEAHVTDVYNALIIQGMAAIDCAPHGWAWERVLASRIAGEYIPLRQRELVEHMSIRKEFEDRIARQKDYLQRVQVVNEALAGRKLTDACPLYPSSPFLKIPLSALEALLGVGEREAG
jgi:hypothetical protein